MKREIPFPPPKDKSRVSLLSGCAIVFVALALGGLIIVGVLGWWMISKQQQIQQQIAEIPRAPEMPLPRIANVAELRAALAGFSGERFSFYASIPGLGDEIKTTMERGNAGEAIAAEAQVAAFEWLLRNYSAIRQKTLEGMVSAYGEMRRTTIEEFDKRESSVANLALRAFGFPAMQDMFPIIKTIEDMERRWQSPKVVIAPVSGGEGSDPMTVIQSLPSWNPEDTFGVVLYKGEIVYIGDNPDYQWPPLSGDAPKQAHPAFSGMEAESARSAQPPE